MLSRVADSLYWMSRYMERAENVARFIDVNWHLALDVPGDPGSQWGPLVATTGDRAWFEEQYGGIGRENVIRFLVFDSAYANSVLSCVGAARENARAARQFITLEMWEQLNNFYLKLRGAVTEQRVADLTHDFFTDIMMAGQLFTGITDSTMTHGEGWNFIRLGRMLERADKTSRLLDVKSFMLLPSAAYEGSPYDDLLWAAVLRSASAFEMYRKRYHQITPERVVAFLVLESEFPRAVHHCVVEAEEAVRAVSGTPGGSFRNQAERRLGRLRAQLDFAQVEEILSGGLHEFLDDLQVRLNDVGQAVFDTFFALRPTVAASAAGGRPAQ